MQMEIIIAIASNTTHFRGGGGGVYLSAPCLSTLAALSSAHAHTLRYGYFEKACTPLGTQKSRRAIAVT